MRPSQVGALIRELNDVLAESPASGQLLGPQEVSQKLSPHSREVLPFADACCWCVDEALTLPMRPDILVCSWRLGSYSLKQELLRM